MPEYKTGSGEQIQLVVDEIEGQRTYEMNAAVLKTADEMLGTLLDTKA